MSAAEFVLAGPDELIRRIADVSGELADVVERLQGLLWKADRLRVAAEVVGPPADDDVDRWGVDSGVSDLVDVGHALHCLAADFDADWRPTPYDFVQVYKMVERVRGNVAGRRARLSGGGDR
jgi:hypothetical protein